MKCTRQTRLPECNVRATAFALCWTKEPQPSEAIVRRVGQVADEYRIITTVAVVLTGGNFWLRKPKNLTDSTGTILRGSVALKVARPLQSLIGNNTLTVRRRTAEILYRTAASPPTAKKCQFLPNISISISTSTVQQRTVEAL